MQSLIENGQLEEALALAEGNLGSASADDARFQSALARVRVQSGFRALTVSRVLNLRPFFKDKFVRTRLDDFRRLLHVTGT